MHGLKMVRLAVIVNIFVICFIECIDGQYPYNPCPELFEYELNGTVLQGTITLQNPPAYGTTFFVNVSFGLSFNISDDNKGSLELVKTMYESAELVLRRQPLKYRLEFPIADEIPRIIKIIVNNETLCNGFKGDEKIRIMLRNTLTTGIQGSTSKTPQPIDECGRLDTTKRRNPTEGIINRGEWPWLVAILLKDPRSLFICAGTLVSRTVVVTAAHCMYDDESRRWNAVDLVVKAGSNDLDDRNERNVQIREVRSITVNSDYNKQTRSNDIAIVKTKDRVTYNDYVKPVCLWTGKTEQTLWYGRNATVAGWGLEERTIPSTDGVRLVKDLVVSTADCRGSHNFFQATTSDNTLCAGRLGSSRPCAVDFGSGLIIHRKNVNSTYQLRGIASNSPMSNRLICTHYVVYTDVTKYDQWIRQEMERN